MMGLFTTRQDLNLKKMEARILKVAKLDGETFRELRDDPSATAQSVFLVAIVALSYGAGWSLFSFLVGEISILGISTITLANFAAGIGIAFAWSGASFVILTKLFRRNISYLELARPFFFSWSPGLLFIFMFAPIPVVSDAIRAVSTAWVIIANVFAVKNAAGISVQRSMLTFIISTISLFFVGSLILSFI